MCFRNRIVTPNAKVTLKFVPFTAIKVTESRRLELRQFGADSHVCFCVVNRSSLAYAAAVNLVVTLGKPKYLRP